MSIKSKLKALLPIVVIAALGIGPLIAYVVESSNKTTEFNYNFAVNESFQSIEPINDKLIQYKRYDKLFQYRFDSGSNEPEFITTILIYFSQQSDKEAISSVNKAYPKDWGKLQVCSLQVERNNEPYYFNVTVSSNKQGRTLSSIVFYKVANRIFVNKIKAKANNLVETFQGNSAITVVAMTFAGNLCSLNSTINEKGIVDVFDIIESKQVNNS